MNFGIGPFNAVPNFFRICGDEVKQESYHKPLNEEERAGLKDILSEVSINLSNEEAEYKEVKKHWRKEVIKPLKQERSSTIDKLKTGTENMAGWRNGNAVNANWY